MFDWTRQILAGSAREVGRIRGSSAQGWRAKVGWSYCHSPKECEFGWTRKLKKIMVSLAILRSQYDLLIDMKQVQGPNKFQQVLVAAFSLFIGILLARAMGL